MEVILKLVDLGIRYGISVYELYVRAQARAQAENREISVFDVDAIEAEISEPPQPKA